MEDLQPENRLTHSWPVTLLQTHSFLWPQAELGNPFFYPRLALRDEPSTTRKKWLTLLATYTHNIFGQHVAILRDVRLAFGSSGSLLWGSKAEGGPQLEYTHTLLTTRSL